MDKHKEILESLKNRGFRLTKVRKALIEALAMAKKPLSVSELLACLGQYGLNPHKTSVYRELNFMLERKMVIRITFGEKQDRFELLPSEHHHHAVCERCGEVEEVDCFEGIKKIEKMLSLHNFKVNKHLIEFLGLCEKCR